MALYPYSLTQTMLVAAQPHLFAFDDATIEDLATALLQKDPEKRLSLQKAWEFLDALSQTAL